MNTSITFPSGWMKNCLLLGMLVFLWGCATTDQLNALQKELSEKMAASQEAQKADMTTQVQKTRDQFEAKIGRMKSEVAEEADEQKKLLTSKMENLRQEFDDVREQVNHLKQIEAEVREIKNQTRYIQTGFKDNLRGQAALLREELEMIEKTLKGMELPPE